MKYFNHSLWMMDLHTQKQTSAVVTIKLRIVTSQPGNRGNSQLVCDSHAALDTAETVDAELPL